MIIYVRFLEAFGQSFLDQPGFSNMFTDCNVTKAAFFAAARRILWYHQQGWIFCLVVGLGAGILNLRRDKRTRYSIRTAVFFVSATDLFF